MDPKLQEAWNELRKSVSIEQTTSAYALALFLLVGGGMALYLRFLYRVCGVSASDSDAITRIFPLLTIVTIAVISVVKSSMALSLGLVGALSIVRFRSAIKEPEELVYLFLCIGIGLALGASQPLFAVVLVLVASIFILGLHFFSAGRSHPTLLLTISGDASQHFSGADMPVMKAIEMIVGKFSIQRLDVESDRGQVRLMIREKDAKQTTLMLAKLREALPACDISYVNMRSVS